MIKMKINDYVYKHLSHVRMVLMFVAIILTFSVVNVLATNTITTAYPHYMDLSNGTDCDLSGQNELVECNYSDSVGLPLDNIGHMVTFSINDSFSNMTYNSGKKVWYAHICENGTVEHDIDFNCTGYTNNTNISDAHIDVTAIGVARFHVPFILTINLYKSTNDYNDTTPYLTDFQYIYINYNTTDVIGLSSGMFADMSYLDSWFSWVPFYKTGQLSSSVKIDTTVTMWDKYEGGSATIKMYEASNKPINVGVIVLKEMGQEWEDYVNFTREFIRPQFDSVKYKSLILKNYELYTEQDMNLKIFVSKYEVSKFHFILNLGYKLLWIGFYILIIVLISCVNSKAGIAIAVALLPGLTKLLDIW